MKFGDMATFLRLLTVFPLRRNVLWASKVKRPTKHNWSFRGGFLQAI